MTHSHKSLSALIGGLSLLTAAAFGQYQNHDLSTPPTPETVNGAQRSSTPDAVKSEKADKEDLTVTSISRFKALDTDNDGRISRSEFATAPNRHFYAGKSAEVLKPEQRATAVTDSNLRAPVASNSYELFNQIDKDNDGFLSKAEIADETNGNANKP